MKSVCVPPSLHKVDFPPYLYFEGDYSRKKLTDTIGEITHAKNRYPIRIFLENHMALCSVWGVGYVWEFRVGLGYIIPMYVGPSF